jgi:hypothetical protein
MNKIQQSINKTLGISLLIFPSMLLLSFVMHMHSFADFFEFRLKPQAYHPDELFYTLVYTGGANFIHSHAIAYLCVPFMLFTILCLGYLLYPHKPIHSIVGVVIGVFGTVFLAGFFAAWLSFSAVSKVEPPFYEGAKAALAALTSMAGVLKVITQLSFLSLLGIIILCLSLLTTKLLPKWSPLFIITGCLLIGIFWSLVNWMLIGSTAIFVGLLPISKLLQQKIVVKSH